MNKFLENIKSIKSIDLTASTYKNASKLKNKLIKDIDSLASFSEATWNGIEHKVVEGTSRTLEIAIPPVEMTAEQAKVFAEITEYAKEKGVTIVTKVVE